MIESVEVRNSQGSSLTLPLGDDMGGYSVQKIEGLDPVQATLVSSNFATMDGAQYQNSRRETRNIKLTLGYSPDYINTTVSSLRNTLYAYFMPKSTVTLTFNTDDGLSVDISGVVETFEHDRFAQDEPAVISIINFDPDFIDPEPVVVEGTTVSTDDMTLLTYSGTVSTGIEFILSANRLVDKFSIYHQPPDGTLRTLDFTLPVISGDSLTIGTVPGNKHVILSDGSTPNSVLYGMTPYSDWITLLPGDNYFRVYAEGAAVPFDISYYNRYGAL